MDAPSPGSLIRLDPERWEAAGIALVLEAPSDRFTDTDFMGRPYVWLLMPGEQGSEHPPFSCPSATSSRSSPLRSELTFLRN